MNSRKFRKTKKHTGRNIIIVLLSLVVLLGLIAFGAVMLERKVISTKMDSVVSKIVPDTSSLTETSSGTASEVKSATPSAIANQLNENTDSIVSQSQGLIDQAQATSYENGVTYTLKSSKLNKTTVNAALLTNGDQVETIANQALEAMKNAGISQPKLKINVTDAQGNIIKTLSYTK